MREIPRIMVCRILIFLWPSGVLVTAFIVTWILYAAWKSMETSSAFGEGGGRVCLVRLFSAPFFGRSGNLLGAQKPKSTKARSVMSPKSQQSPPSVVA